MEGERQMLVNQTRLKFGLVRDDQLAPVAQADDATLARFSERVLTADSGEAVLSD